ENLLPDHQSFAFTEAVHLVDQTKNKVQNLVIKVHVQRWTLFEVNVRDNQSTVPLNVLHLLGSDVAHLLHSSNVDTGKALVSADPAPAVITPILLENRDLSTSEPTLLQVRATTVRACVLVSLLVKTVRGVRGDSRKQLVVELLSDHNILDVVLLHLLPSLVVAGHALDPELMSPVLDLVVQPELLGDVVELVAREPEVLLDDLQEVDLRVRRRRSQASLNELPVQVRNVEPLAIEVDNCIGCAKKPMSLLYHRFLTIMEGATENGVWPVFPLGREADDFSGLKELTQGHILLPQSPHMRKLRTCLDIYRQ